MHNPKENRKHQVKYYLYLTAEQPHQNNVLKRSSEDVRLSGKVIPDPAFRSY